MEPNKKDSIPSGDTPMTNLRDIWGLFKVVSSAPVTSPRKLQEQIVIYKNGGTKRLYWYDPINGVWSYVTATA